MKGFTLIELLITVVIAAILLAIATPSYQQMTMRNQVSSLSYEFSSALRFAQSEAIRRNTRVSITPHATATGNQWTNGWDIYVDNNNFGTKNSSEELIRTFSLNSIRSTLIANDSVFSSYISFLPMGTTNGNSGFSGNFRLCPPNSDTTIAQTIYIERSGNINAQNEASQCP